MSHTGPLSPSDYSGDNCHTDHLNADFEVTATISG